jgi:hypothetical protein
MIEQILISILIVVLLILIFFLLRKLKQLQGRITDHEEPLVVNRNHIIIPMIRAMEEGLLERNLANRIELIEPRVEPIVETIGIGDTKSAIVDSYYQKVQTHDNDSQNSHDSFIVKCLVKKYKRLVELNADLPKPEIGDTDPIALQNLLVNTTFMEIRNEAMKMKHFELTRINLVLADIAKGSPISYLDTTEDIVLMHVWRRIHAPANTGNTNMVMTLLEQLINATEQSTPVMDLINGLLPELNFHIPRAQQGPVTYSVVCCGGRIARILSSLTLQDADPILAEPEKDGKELANEAYTKSHKIYCDMLATQSDEFKKIYEQIDTSTLSDAEKKNIDEFNDSVKKQIEIILKQDYIDINSEALNIIIKTAQSAII